VASASGEIKSLTTRRQVLVAELEEVKAQRNAVDRQAGEIHRREDNIQRKIAEIDKRLGVVRAGPVVTEHAILRFLERGMGMDMEDIRNQILTPDVRSALGSGLDVTIGISQGCRAIIKGGVVVSVIGGEFGS